MKTLKFGIILLLIFGCSNIYGQISRKKTDRDKFVFWFYIRAQEKISNETKKEVYMVSSSARTPKSGNLLKYEKDNWRCLKGGHQLTIGPFSDYNDCIRSINMYDLRRHNNASMEKEIANFVDSTAADEYYWFFLKYKKMKRRGFILKRTAARVASGSLKEFKQVLWEGLGFKQLAIGPFPSQEEAEEAKRLYRLEED